MHVLRTPLIFKGYIYLSQRFAQLVFRVFAALRCIFLQIPFSKIGADSRLFSNFRTNFSKLWLKGIFALSHVFSHQVTPGHILI